MGEERTIRMCDLKRMEVINICDGKRLGFVGDLEFDQCTGKIKCLIIPGPGCIWGFLGHEKEFTVPFEDICQIGNDIILVEIKDRDKDRDKHK